MVWKIAYLHMKTTSYLHILGSKSELFHSVGVTCGCRTCWWCSGWSGGCSPPGPPSPLPPRSSRTRSRWWFHLGSCRTRCRTWIIYEVNKQKNTCTSMLLYCTFYVQGICTLFPHSLVNLEQGSQILIWRFKYGHKCPPLPIHRFLFFVSNLQEMGKICYKKGKRTREYAYRGDKSSLKIGPKIIPPSSGNYSKFITLSWNANTCDHAPFYLCFCSFANIFPFKLKVPLSFVYPPFSFTFCPDYNPPP